MKNYKIDLSWDNEVSVWIATSRDEDISGLVLESGSLDALIERIKVAIPELLEENRKRSMSAVNLTFASTRSEVVNL